MEEIMLAHLRRFFDYNGRPPERILFYRDGVGLSQFAIIQEREISAIRRACRRVGGDTYSPKLVFVVVQKRNHCRIFSMQGNRVDNAQPGTVVDKEITTAAQFDFYMCSHFGLKGTSRPTHYHVLCDDLALRSDDLQRFTFDLCHLYARCTKIVSSPAPTYYAHLAAYHAHYYMSNFKDEDDNWEHASTVSSSDSGGPPSTNRPCVLRRPHLSAPSWMARRRRHVQRRAAPPAGPAVLHVGGRSGAAAPGMRGPRSGYGVTWWGRGRGGADAAASARARSGRRGEMRMEERLRDDTSWWSVYCGGSNTILTARHMQVLSWHEEVHAPARCAWFSL